jgi:heme-degrading monooxygenase HmoA
MIARRWTARATPENARRYTHYFRDRLTPHLRALGGYRGATLLEREGDFVTEIVVITYWESMAAVRHFAGPDPTAAVVSDEAKPLLLDGDPHVDHYEVAFAERL